MDKHWHYLEQDITRRREIHRRQFAEARREQELFRQRFKAVLKLAQHFASRGVKITTDLVCRKGLSAFKRRKDTK